MGFFVDGLGCLWLVVHEMRGFCGWVVVFGDGCPWNVGFSWISGGAWGWLSMKCGVFVDGWWFLVLVVHGMWGFCGWVGCEGGEGK